MPAPVAVGVDNGGTWIRFKGLNTKGRCVWSLKNPSPTVDQLPNVLRHHLKRFHLSYLAVGSRGVWTQAKRRSMKRALQGLAKKIVVMSDVEAAWLAAFGAKCGIIVISGTGSIAYGRKIDGTFVRTGGLGPDKGDEGSGYWIGKKWLQKQPSATATTVRQIASLAPRVIDKARRGNLLARGITHDAQQHLCSLVINLIEKLHWTRVVPLAASGSVLENQWFKQGFLKMLHAKGIKFKFTPKKTDQAIALLTSYPSPLSGV